MTVPPPIRDRVRRATLAAIVEGLRREHPGHEITVVDPDDPSLDAVDWERELDTPLPSTGPPPDPVDRQPDPS